MGLLNKKIWESKELRLTNILLHSLNNNYNKYSINPIEYYFSNKQTHYSNKLSQ